MRRSAPGFAGPDLRPALLRDDHYNYQHDDDHDYEHHY